MSHFLHTCTLFCQAKLIHAVNNFPFDSSNFLQINGVVMGTDIVPSYACLLESSSHRIVAQKNLQLNLPMPTEMPHLNSFHLSAFVPYPSTFHFMYLSKCFCAKPTLAQLPMY